MDNYSRFLEKSGRFVIKIDGVCWHEYHGFMVPSYLPGYCPKITEDIAIEVLRNTKKLFVRWEEKFSKTDQQEWWHVLKRGHWKVADIPNSKRRWKIRRARKRFTTRKMEFEEVIEKCPLVSSAAAVRYKGNVDTETESDLTRTVEAGRAVPGVLEYFGCFHNDTLVSYSENHIQGNGVWLATIRHDPKYFPKYSSYAFIDGSLNYYLNQRQFDYVTDGSRSIHHRTNFQDFLIKEFGFTKECAILNVLYSPKFRPYLETLYPFRKIILYLQKVVENRFLDNVGAVLFQEQIRRSCLKQTP